MAKRTDISPIISEPLQPINHIENMIFEVRGKQIMLDRDLALLYGIETKRLNEQVRRNSERFPDDFMFRLTKEEFENWKSQFAIPNNEDSMRSQNATSYDQSNLKSQNATSNKRGGLRYLPYAFTENGIAMLSSVLRSSTAIQVNIKIMRAFTAMRHFIALNAQMFQRLEIMERNQLAINAHLADTDHKLEEVFRRLDDNSVTPQQGIFYDGQVFDAYKFIAERVKEAKTRIILFDNYIDESVLNVLDKRETSVVATVYTKAIDAHLQTDIARHDAQYPPINVIEFSKAHDRFLCIDDTVYHIGASLKDLGKRWFAFNRMEQTTDDLLAKM